MVEARSNRLGTGRVEATLPCVDSPEPSPAERRSDSRHLTLLRVGALITGDRRELCLVRNISAGGMMLRVYSPVGAGQQASVELKSGTPLQGRISWVRDGQAGLEFDSPIDVARILSQDEASETPRLPRIETDVVVQVREGARFLTGRCSDISQGGVKVELRAALAVDSEVVVSVPGLDPQAGRVRWSEPGMTGLAFNRLLPLSTLVGWLQSQRGAPDLVSRGHSPSRS